MTRVIGYLFLVVIPVCVAIWSYIHARPCQWCGAIGNTVIYYIALVVFIIMVGSIFEAISDFIVTRRK